MLITAKSIALTAVFGSLAVILNPAISGIGFAYPLLPGLWFEIWEIPLIAAFLLFGFRIALSASIINAVFLGTVFPGPSQPYYALSTIATIGMMLGIYLSLRIFRQKTTEPKILLRTKFLSVAVILATFFRIAFMGPSLFSILYFDPLGVYPPMPPTYIIATILPFDAFFNVIVTIYTVPISYLAAKLVSKNLKIGNQIP